MGDSSTGGSLDVARPRPGRLAWIVVLVAVLGAAAVRVRLLDVPLERDEGEYAYAGQLLLDGVPPYQLAYNMKFPGTYAAYALVMAVFGESVRGIHLGLLLVNAATTLLTFLLVRRLFDDLSGAIAALAHASLSLSQSVYGPFAHATHFVILPALGGTLLLLRGLERERRRELFLAGALLGLAPIMKQHGLFFPLLAGVHLLWDRARQRAGATEAARDGAIYALGVAAPAALAAGALVAAGVFPKFWFWAFTYAGSYVSQTDLASGMAVGWSRLRWIVSHSPGLWALAAVGLTSLAWDRGNRRRAGFTILFALGSFLAVCPGLYFRPHYFVVFLPAVALLAGIGAGALWRRLLPFGRPFATAAALLLALAATFVQLQREGDLFFRLTPAQASRQTYPLQPFPEAVEIGRKIAAETAPGDRIAVLGSEPEIFFYAGRRSATGHIYMYSLMEDQPHAEAMQREAIAEIEAADPEWVVLVRVSGSWLISPESQRLILEWAPPYLDERYVAEGLVDIVSTEQTRYLWGPEARGAVPESPRHLWVFRRRPRASGSAHVAGLVRDWEDARFREPVQVASASRSQRAMRARSVSMSRSVSQTSARPSAGSSSQSSAAPAQARSGR